MILNTHIVQTERIHTLLLCWGANLNTGPVEAGYGITQTSIRFGHFRRRRVQRDDVVIVIRAGRDGG